MNQKEAVILAHILNDTTILAELNLKIEMFSDLGKIIFKHAQDNLEIKEAALLAEVEEHLDDYLEIVNHYDPGSTEIVSKLFIEDYNRELHLKASYKHYARLTEAQILPEESLMILNKDIEAGIVQKEDKYKTRVNDIRELRDRFGKPSVNPLYNGIDTWHDNVGAILPNKLKYTGAKAGTGKTQLILEEMYHLAIQGYTCIFYSLEMPEDICNLRILAIHLGLPFYVLELAYYGQDIIGDDTKQKVYKGLNEIADLNIIIVDDQYYLSEIETSAKMYFRKYGTVYAGIDYAQLIRVTERFDRADLQNAYISERLAKLRKDTCTINVLSQVNESGNLRGGGWDQAADDVFYLSRSNDDLEDLIEDESERDSILKYGMITTVKKCRSNGNIVGQSFLNIMSNGRYATSTKFTTNAPF